MQIGVQGSESEFLEKALINLTDLRDISLECCLQLPEGSLKECKILFEYSIKCALSCPNIRFIWIPYLILLF
jgi:hypothetical protein